MMWKKIVFDSVPLLAVVAIVYVILNALDVFKPEPDKRPAKQTKINVFVETSRQQTVPLFAYSQGEVKPKRQIDFRSQVEGRLMYVDPDFVAGGRFTRGQTLMQIDKRDFELAVVQREAAVAKAEQELARVEAQARIAQAELDQLGRVKANDLARWIPQLNHAKADVDAAQAMLQKARLDLARTTVTAPFSGIVRHEAVDVGVYVSRNSTLATLYASDVMEVELALNGHQLALIDLPLNFYTREYDQGIPVTLTAEIGDKTLQWQAAIVRTDAAFDRRTGTLKAIAEVHQDKNAGVAIVPGLYVNAKITGHAIPQASILARTSLRTNNEVWLVDEDSRLQVLSVDIAHRDSEQVVVTGLPERSRVVTSSLAVATPGTLVRAIRPQQPQPVAQVESRKADTRPVP